jgi:hypothetical protein
MRYPYQSRLAVLSLWVFSDAGKRRPTPFYLRHSLAVRNGETRNAPVPGSPDEWQN